MLSRIVVVRATDEKRNHKPYLHAEPCKGVSQHLGTGDPRDKHLQRSYSLNSLKGGYIGDYLGYDYKVIIGDTRSLDYSSYV